MDNPLLLTKDDLWAEITWAQSAVADMHDLIDAFLPVAGKLRTGAFVANCHDTAELAAQDPYAPQVWHDASALQWRRLVMRGGKLWLFYSAMPKDPTPRHKASITIERIIQASRYSPDTLLTRHE